MFVSSFFPFALNRHLNYSKHLEVFYLLTLLFGRPVVSRLFNNVEFNDNRKNPSYAKVELLLQMLIQVIEGYWNDDVADFYHISRTKTLMSYKKLNRRFVSLIDERSANTELVLDLDSTYVETFGDQEKMVLIITT